MTNSVFLIRIFKANHQHSLYQSVGFTRTGRSIDGDVWFSFSFTNFLKFLEIKNFKTANWQKKYLVKHFKSKKVSNRWFKKSVQKIERILKFIVLEGIVITSFPAFLLPLVALHLQVFRTSVITHSVVNSIPDTDVSVF